MKYPLHLLLAFFILAATSCSMDKRLYRDGWYVDRHSKISHEENFVADKSDTISTQQVTQTATQPATSPDTLTRAEAAPGFVPQHAPEFLKEKIRTLEAKKQQVAGDPDRMTYIQARKSMAEKGCKPNGMAMTVYYLSVASAIACWFGIGLLLLLVTLVISIFAVNTVIAAGGDCIDENLAIIKAGRRICFIALITFAIVTLLVLALIFGLIPYLSAL